MNFPKADEYAPFYANYIAFAEQTGAEDLFTNIYDIHNDTQDFLLDIDPKKHNYRYAEGKWSIKEVIQHLIDTERIMGYRALRIARGDKTPLAGFEQDDYAAMANVDSHLFDQMTDEWESLRESNFYMFSRFSDEELARTGTASGFTVSVRALGAIILGQELHHINGLKDGYL